MWIKKHQNRVIYPNTEAEKRLQKEESFKMISALKRLLIGRPLKSEELAEEKLSKFKALAILSSDALSSVAYGTEQILIVLMTVGAVALWYSVPFPLPY